MLRKLYIEFFIVWYLMMFFIFKKKIKEISKFGYIFRLYKNKNKD